MENDIELNQELEKRKEELINEFESIEANGELIGDIFYNSMKEFFDLGLKLAKDLASEDE